MTDALSDGVSTLVFGELRSAPNADYLVDVYTGPEDPASGSCEARAHIGAVSVHTDATGRGTFFLSSSTVVPWGEVVSATATSAPGGDTSELSPCTSVHPPS